jgi:hypothetical protein
MTKNVKFATLTAAALISASMLGGCATTDKEARDMAQAAMDAANAAQACCNANEERINRMYQKIMSK